MRNSTSTANRCVGLLSMCAVCSGTPITAPRVFAAPPPASRRFVYDVADTSIKATILGESNDYDAAAVSNSDGLWITWLEFVPGKGDHIWIGCRKADEWSSKTRITSSPGEYANPTLTRTTDGRLWLSYEARLDGQWDVWLTPRGDDGTFGTPRRISTSPGPDILHRTAAAPDGSLWLVWQSDHDGQFDIITRRIRGEAMSDIRAVSESPFGDWHPDIAAAPDGTIFVVWDGCTDDGYDVFVRTCRANHWGGIARVSADHDQPGVFDGRARVTAGKDGRVWCLWEEGNASWGAPWRSWKHTAAASQLVITEAHGPLHGERRLRLALLAPDGTPAYVEPALPMPAIADALKRPGAAGGSASSIGSVGAFYECGNLAVDGAGRVWVTYRHYYAPFVGVEKITHVQDSWGLYARCLDGAGWSKLYRFDIGQGDGMQRMEIVPEQNGIAAVWTTGRTDRKERTVPRGVALASITANGASTGKIAATAPRRFESRAAQAAPTATSTQPASVGGREYQLFFGDLHRHTDLSLCFVPTDGTIDDAYRYAIDVARLDFLGITDHTHDLVMGDRLSQLWWRCVKEVTRHELTGRFVPMFSYERSRPDTDHNVISLRPDMLRPHTYALAKFWQELDRDTFTIPHQPFNRITWEKQDNDRRPLLEMFQGYRNRSVESDANAGLARGYLFGFIASSDHLSTGASFAGVWAPERTRESIFRAMQARRTFAATDKIRLLVRAGDHWMGEQFAAPSFPAITIEADGTAPIDTLEVIIDGETRRTWKPGQPQARMSYTPEALGAGVHYLYIRLNQADANQAWSSPIWVEVTAEGADQSKPDGPNCCPPRTQPTPGS